MLSEDGKRLKEAGKQPKKENVLPEPGTGKEANKVEETKAERKAREKEAKKNNK